MGFNIQGTPTKVEQLGNTIEAVSPVAAPVVAATPAKTEVVAPEKESKDGQPQ